MKKILFLMLCAIMICAVGCSKEEASEQQQNNNSTQNGNQNNSGNQNGSGNQNNDIQNQINELFGDEATIQKRCEETFSNQIGEAEYYCDHRRDNEALYAAYYPNDMVIIFKIKLKEVEIIDLINRDMPTDTLDWYLPPYIKYNNENLKVVKINIQNEIMYLKNCDRGRYYPEKNIYMPNTIKDVEHLHDTNPNKVFFSNSVKIVNKDCFKGTLHDFSYEYYYENSSYVKYVKLPENLETIPEYFFYHESDLETIILPKNLKTIENEAFTYCNKLKQIEIPNSVTHLRFGGTGLTSITIPNSVTYLLLNCSNLTSITIPNSVIDLHLDGSGLTSIEIPNSVTNLDLSCSNLTSIDIPNSVTSLELRGCSKLTSVTIPNSVTEIGSSAFEGCTGLTSINIPNSVTEIGSSAFEGCTGLTSIEIPNSVTEIGIWAFEGCTELSSITIPTSVSPISYSTFQGCNNLTSIKFNGDYFNEGIDVSTIIFPYLTYIPSLKTIYVKEGIEIPDHFATKYEIIRF